MGFQARFVFPVLLAFTAGCGSTSKYRGYWVGAQVVPGAPVYYGETLKIRLNLTPEGQVEYYRMGFDWKGTWRETSDGVEVTLKQTMERAATSPIVFTLKPDGESLLLEDEYTKGKQAIRLNRATPPSQPRKD